MEEFGNEPEPCNERHPRYVPHELVNCSSNTCNITYYCYLIELKQNFNYCDISVDDIVLAMRSELDSEIASTQFEMCVERGNLSVKLRQVETVHLSPDEVRNCRRFQTTLFRILLDGNVNKPTSVSDEFCLEENPEIDYLLLPANVEHQRPSNSIIDWKSVSSVPFSSESTCECRDHAHDVSTKNGLVCSCKLRNCVVTTPHNGVIYIIDGVTKLNGNSRLRHLRGKGNTTYKEHFKNNHGVQLQFEHESLLNGRHVFKVNNYLLKGRQKKDKGSRMNSAELPPELCSVIMSPISISTIYSFSFIPSIMHRLESLLIAFNLKKMLLDHCTQNDISIFKVLQAITAKECQEAYDYDSLETLGDSFLKYAASQQLFKTNQNDREGLLTEARMKITSNVALCKFGCSRRLPGFIRKGTFDPKQWIIPGDKSKSLSLEKELVSNRTRVYVGGRREINHKVVADVVEALIGAFVSTGDEEAALSFMNWIGIHVDTNIIPYERNLGIPPENLLNVTLLESHSLLNYSFKDPSLLVEALTHGSYKRPGISRCYQRLEFLGDAVLDYLFTLYFYNEYPDKSSEFLTVMRSISANNECYAVSAINAKLHEHILRHSEKLDKQIAATVNEVEKLSLKSTYGWQLETTFPEVLADIIESLAGAIFVDSGYNKEAVFQSIRPLLDPLVTPETAKLHPVGELNELCSREHYKRKKPLVSRDSGVSSVTIEVEANGKTYKCTRKANNKDTAEKLASKEVLKLLKSCNPVKVLRTETR